jgi:hypothetical protein
MTLEEVREILDEVLIADGFNEAVIGYDDRSHRVVYDAYECIMILMNRDKMSYDEALEFLEHNTFSAYVGENTPIFIWK